MVSEEVRTLEAENVLLKDQLDQLKTLYGCGIEMPKDCEHCKNFVQLYVKVGAVYTPTYDGHCIAGGRVRSRNRDRKETCGSFLKKEFGKNYI